MPVNLHVLPEILALSGLVLLLQPLGRRSDLRATPWLLGWVCLLAHYVVRAFVPDDAHGAAGLAMTWTLLLTALLFLRAAANQTSDKLDWTYFSAVSIPVLAVGAGLRLFPGVVGYERFAALLFALPMILLLQNSSHRRRPLVGIAAICAAVGVSLFFLTAIDTTAISVAAGGMLSVLFLTVAWTYATEVGKLTRATVAATIGLAGWGFSYPVVALIQQIWPALAYDHHLARIPQYLTGAALTLALIEQLLYETEYMAMHDPLTGLANRRLLEQHVHRAIAVSVANAKPLALLVIDIDGFKQINDTLGHAVGDELLRALAVRLSWHIGPSDILARTGGDEFTAILAGTADEHHLRFVARAMMSAASVPFSIGSESIDCHISVGIALGREQAIDIAELRRAADYAMYRAKRQGGGAIAFADTDCSLEDPNRRQPGPIAEMAIGS